MAEFALVTGVFVLLVLGTALLYRFHEIQRQALVAAREAAFSGMWLQGRIAPEVLQRGIRRRHFDRPGWVDPTGNEALPGRDDAVMVQVSNAAPPGKAPGAVAVALQPLRAVGGFLGPGFDLPMDRHAQARVDVTLAPIVHLPEPLDSLHPLLSAHLGLLGDEWMASGPGVVASRTAGLMPAGFLRAQSAWIKPLLWPASLIEPAIAQLCLGLIEPDRVPEDRLSATAASRRQPGDPSCH
ncbi:MAG: hypothetical protein RLZZ393_554 [Pseudomonadota bacterium]|jgi:hypothetical protein